MIYRYSENDVGPGWRPTVKAAIEQIVQFGGAITQIKEKFGGLRIYTYGGDQDKIDQVVQEAEFACARLCEECGDPGDSVEIRGWYKTLCPYHAESA